MFRVKSSLSSEIFHVTKSNGGCCVSCSPNICLVQVVPPRDKKGHNHRRQGTSLQAKRKQVQIKMSHVSPLSVMNRVRRTRLLHKSSCGQGRQSARHKVWRRGRAQERKKLCSFSQTPYRGRGGRGKCDHKRGSVLSKKVQSGHIHWEHG